MTRCLIALTLLTLTTTASAQPAEDLASSARQVFKKHCSACHVGAGSENGFQFDALDRESMVKKFSDDEQPVLVPKSLESRVYVRAAVEKTMPPRSVKDRPTAVELETLKKWIEAGAPAADLVRKVAFQSNYTQLKAIHDHLADADPDLRPYLRYFTLTNLHNNPAITAEDLRITRAALSKAINSLSRKPRLALPKAIDKDETILVIDLRDLDWDKDNLWHAVLTHYPYGLTYKDSEDDKLAKVQKDLDRLTRKQLVYLRADWFVATATRAPLYYQLLHLPQTTHELRKWLEVDRDRNFRDNKLWRAGFQASGVSGQNRLVERHDSPVGNYYWESYDFKRRSARASLVRFPLGPLFPDNPYPRQAFVHDGGEMIFGLPNGLQGYFLTDGKGKRIDVGPIEVVSDGLKTSGTSAIVNGTSCMHCHKSGIIPVADTIREGHALFGNARDKVLKLYPERKTMDELVKGDEKRFVDALDKTIGPFLKIGAARAKKVTEFTEPIGEVTRRYLAVRNSDDVGVQIAASELGIEKSETLAGMIQGNSTLKELGVLPLAKGKTIKRDDWEAVDVTASLFQDIALALRLGTPLRFR